MDIDRPYIITNRKQTDVTEDVEKKPSHILKCDTAVEQIVRKCRTMRVQK